MQCEMYWGYPAVQCKRQAVSMRDVRLRSGKTKTIGMCAKCQDKYFGKLRRPTSHALDGGDSAARQAVSTPEVVTGSEADTTPPAAQ